MTPLEQNIQNYFGKLTPEELKIITSYFKPVSIEKGSFILRTGSQSNSLCFVQSGLFRIFVQLPEKEVTQWIATPNYFLTDLSSFLFNVPARWNIQALTDVEMLSISKDDYLKLGLQIPKWHELEKMFIAKCFTMLEERVFSFLSLSAEERYKLFYEHNKALFVQVPLQYLASMLGMTPETFSRIRKKIK